MEIETVNSRVWDETDEVTTTWWIFGKDIFRDCSVVGVPVGIDGVDSLTDDSILDGAGLDAWNSIVNGEVVIPGSRYRLQGHVRILMSDVEDYTDSMNDRIDDINDIDGPAADGTASRINRFNQEQLGEDERGPVHIRVADHAVTIPDAAPIFGCADKPIWKQNGDRLRGVFLPGERRVYMTSEFCRDREITLPRGVYHFDPLSLNRGFASDFYDSQAFAEDFYRQ